MVQIFVAASHFVTGEEQAHWHKLQVWPGSQLGWDCLQLMCLVSTSSVIHQSGKNIPSEGPGLSYFSVDRCISQWQMCNVESRKGWDMIGKMCLSDMLGTFHTCGLTSLDSYVFTLSGLKTTLWDITHSVETSRFNVKSRFSIYMCALISAHIWAFETIQKPMKLLAENQFPRCSTVSLTVLLSTWDNNRFYLIILFYLIRVEGENQFPGWTPVATWDTWTLISVWSSSPGVIRPDLINAWLIHTFHILNRRLSQCSVSCFY